MTPVIFRKFKNGGDIIAVFPAMAGDNDPYKTCGSYMNVGQHGAASVNIARITKEATRQEYALLLAELEKIGYDDLKIIRRFNRKHLQLRKKACGYK